MVKIGLQIKAQLQNVTDLTPEGEDFRWYLKLRCVNCGDETPEYVYLTQLESQPLKGGRGRASLVIKCKLCARENSIDIVKDSIKQYTAEDTNKFKTIIVFDCRGVEPIAFDARIGWTAKGEETVTVFPEVDLSQGEWCDYDEKASEPVSIEELQHQFVKA
ncbi:hypothetical protein LSH36_384g01036 [Paralvinella palmiformis]|uniref:CXXC motif containing zinc binding protein n=1 Tax=Paralvinella palmiformis TaxID=53620 RepID=A0AAD9JD10_9ANNE|nr:hypothetical protein LSH36_384g01036 [Paralvinella palmiformis]